MARAAARYASLDAIRGFALIGVVAVNAAYFAAPLASVLNPRLAPLSAGAIDIWTWAFTHIVFGSKSIALFSMLFGASLYLVGGERDDAAAGRALRRRLGWLALFGIAHGILFWFGDILLAYALAGFICAFARSWSPRRLLRAGILLVGLSVAITVWLVWMASAPGAGFEAAHAPHPDDIAAHIGAYRGGLSGAFAANFAMWVEFQLQTIIFLSPRTLGLMLIGLGLFKSGFLKGEAPARAYRRTALIGAAALAAQAALGAALAQAGANSALLVGADAVATSVLAPLTALFYASVIVWLTRTRALHGLSVALAAAGKLAFTNYLTQSIVLSTLMWGGRGFGLYGALSRTEIVALALGLFAVQIAISVLWLKRFAHGPFESIWRKLTAAPPPRTVPATFDAGAAAIESKALVKVFGPAPAVDKIDLYVPQRAIYGFLGPNGAGKTTTIRMLLGLTRPTSGAVKIFGREVLSERIDAARLTGAMLDARSLYEHLSGRDNLAISARLIGAGGRDIDRVLSLVGLAGDARRKVAHYSLGMRQRLGLARALLGQPKLLVLDEPLNGLDPEGIEDMRRLMRALASEGVTLFVSSHLLSEVEQTATHVGLMRRGKLIFEGKLADVVGQAAPDLYMRVDRPDEALAWLRGAGCSAAADGAGILVKAKGADRDAAALARALHERGCAVIELRARQPSLEAMYRTLAFQGGAA